MTGCSVTLLKPSFLLCYSSYKSIRTIPYGQLSEPFVKGDSEHVLLLSAPGPRMLRGPDVVGHGTPRLRGCGAQGESACNESVGTMRTKKDTSGGKSTWLTC